LFLKVAGVAEPVKRESSTLRNKLHKKDQHNEDDGMFAINVIAEV
jgi:hypothetical protein